MPNSSAGTGVFEPGKPATVTLTGYPPSMAPKFAYTRGDLAGLGSFDPYASPAARQELTGAKDPLSNPKGFRLDPKLVDAMDGAYDQGLSGVPAGGRVTAPNVVVYGDPPSEFFALGKDGVPMQGTRTADGRGWQVHELLSNGAPTTVPKLFSGTPEQAARTSVNAMRVPDDWAADSRSRQYVTDPRPNSPTYKKPIEGFVKDGKVYASNNVNDSKPLFSLADTNRVAGTVSQEHEAAYQQAHQGQLNRIQEEGNQQVAAIEDQFREQASGWATQGRRDQEQFEREAAVNRAQAGANGGTIVFEDDGKGGVGRVTPLSESERLDEIRNFRFDDPTAGQPRFEAPAVRERNPFPDAESIPGQVAEQAWDRGSSVLGVFGNNAANTVNDALDFAGEALTVLPGIDENPFKSATEPSRERIRQWFNNNGLDITGGKDAAPLQVLSAAADLLEIGGAAAVVSRFSRWFKRADRAADAGGAAASAGRRLPRDLDGPADATTLPGQPRPPSRQTGANARVPFRPRGGDDLVTTGAPSNRPGGASNRTTNTSPTPSLTGSGNRTSTSRPPPRERRQQHQSENVRPAPRTGRRTEHPAGKRKRRRKRGNGRN